MKKKDIIGVLSETITSDDLEEFYEKAVYLFDILSDDFTVGKIVEQDVIEALATVRVLLQAIIAKLGYTKKVSKAEEKLILSIIKANIVSSDKDDKEGFEDFDIEGFADKEGLEDNEDLEDFDVEGFDDKEGLEDFESLDGDDKFSADGSSDDFDSKISENTDNKLNDIFQDLNFDSDEEFIFDKNEEENSDFDSESEGLDDLGDYCNEGFTNDYNSVGTKTNLKNFKDHSDSSTNSSESDLVSDNFKGLLDIYGNENKKD